MGRNGNSTCELARDLRRHQAECFGSIPKKRRAEQKETTIPSAAKKRCLHLRLLCPSLLLAAQRLTFSQILFQRLPPQNAQGLFHVFRSVVRLTSVLHLHLRYSRLVLALAPQHVPWRLSSSPGTPSYLVISPC